jgi:DNA-binding NarL/FixJ family response regulator
MGLRCLVVEDQLMFRQMLVNMLLTVRGLEVAGVARTAAEAVAACEELEPDLLLLDIALPDGSGLKAARRLAKIKPAAHVLILSGEASTFVCPKELRQQIHAVVDKTQAFDELAAEIRALIPSTRTTASMQTRDAADVRAILTPKEFEIFALMGRGMLSKEIAAILDISSHTVQAHRKTIAVKLGTTGHELLQQAVRYHEKSLETAR